MVLFTHDPCDVLLDLSRVMNDWYPKIGGPLDIVYVSFVISWIFLRLSVFPMCIVRASWNFFASL